MKNYIALLLILLLASCSKVAEKDKAEIKKVRLRLASAYPTHIPLLGSGVKTISSRINQASNDKIAIKTMEPADVGGLNDILDTVSAGTIDMGYSSAGFWSGKMPAGPLFSSVPFGPEAPEYLAWMKYGNGLKLYQKMYDDAGYNVKVIPCIMLPPETSGWFAKEVNKTEDLQGIKMRFFGLGARVMERLGASTVIMGGGEIFQALEKGVLDATEFSMPSIDKNLGFHKIVKYNYFPGWHQQATFLELIVNKDLWESLPEAHKAIIEMACNESLVNSIAEGEAKQFDVMRENIDKNGVHLKNWNKEMMLAFRSAWHDIADEEAKKNKFFAEVWQDLKSFRSDYRLWKDNAFLPKQAND
ncbi:MAG: TRAP transporter substrate-binding protein [Lentisphaeraceae bacterium]|nr:TRAP transporter substrate-binding protein [Lentisphaeraceae bacterium]